MPRKRVQLVGCFAAFLATAGVICAEENRAAEDQTPTGKFLTATEVRPILEATQANWIGVREFDGRDLVYFTHLVSWRCGLYEVRYQINGGPEQLFPISECPSDIVSAMAIPEDAQVFITEALGSVKTVDVTVLYDDLGTASATFARAEVLMP
ncbi:hypothetical protein [Shimia sp.]|uniref:hypothetical protein n=1 Tax=Shimia sp. TaxID=1954381 RepID=UPI003B8AF1CE